MSQQSLIPVTVVGGFLGAGKTTLLNRVLATAQRRYAVLVNDFGAINIDAALIKAEDGFKKQLDNGCICCSTSGGLAVALDQVLSLPQLPEAIIIEASGVGDPWRIAELAIIDPRLTLDIVLTLADAGNLARHLRDDRLSDTLERQLRRADLVVLNKVDTVGADTLERARGAIGSIAPAARVVETVNAELPSELLSSVASAVERSRAVITSNPGHENTFARWMVPAELPLNRDRLEAGLSALPSGLLRLKGWLRIAGSDDVYLLQYVAGRHELSVDNTPQQRLGLVGIGLPDTAIAPALAALTDAARDWHPGLAAAGSTALAAVQAR